MKFISPEEIYRAKVERREQLRALSVVERIELIEKLRDMGRTMIAARKTIVHPV